VFFRGKELSGLAGRWWGGSKTLAGFLKKHLPLCRRYFALSLGGQINPPARTQLKKLPLRWINYLLLNKARFQLPLTFAQSRAMGEGFQVEVRAVGGDEFEATVFRQREKPVRRRQSLSRGQVLVIGGKAGAGSDCWLVLLRRAE